MRILRDKFGRPWPLYQIEEFDYFGIPRCEKRVWIPGFRWLTSIDEEVVPVIRARSPYIVTPVGVWNYQRHDLISVNIKFYTTHPIEVVRKFRLPERSMVNAALAILAGVFFGDLRAGWRFIYGVEPTRRMVKTLAWNALGYIMVDTLEDLLREKGITLDWIIDNYKQLVEGTDKRIAKEVLDGFASLYGVSMNPKYAPPRRAVHEADWVEIQDGHAEALPEPDELDREAEEQEL